MAPQDRVFVCRECLSHEYENEAPERIDLGDCSVCGLKEVGYTFEVPVLRKRER
jgi:hypothetical protein